MRAEHFLRSRDASLDILLGLASFFGGLLMKIELPVRILFAARPAIRGGQMEMRNGIIRLQFLGDLEGRGGFGGAGGPA